LPYLFPNATITVNKNSPTTFRTGEGKKHTSLLSATWTPTVRGHRPAEFCGEGNHVFISAHHVGDTLLHILGLKAGWGLDQGFEPDSLRLKLRDPLTTDYQSFAYPEMPTTTGSLPSIPNMRCNGEGSPRPARFYKAYLKSGGTVYLQLAPLAFPTFSCCIRQQGIL